MYNYDELKLKLDSLAVFKDIKKDPVIVALRNLLEERTVASYAEFLGVLYPHGANFSQYVRKLILEDDNFYIKAVAAGEPIEQEILTSVINELAVLEEISKISSDEFNKLIDRLVPVDTATGKVGNAPLAGWKTEDLNLIKDFTDKLASIPKTGYGIFAKYTFFRVSDDGEIIPVKYPDYIPIDQLYEYERERNIIIKNTEALVEGQHTNNVLLYGDMGTGKSSTIKSIAAAYADQGLRIVEIKKNQLFLLPDIMEELASNPLKFILFIDDLSFSRSDDNFTALKAALEGSVSGRSNNTAIYATSNRRHLVRESAADRYGGIGMDEDMHVNDTLQETTSLSARFGLTVTFQQPGKDEYLSIVRSLAEETGIDVNGDSENAISEEMLCQKAEAFAIRRNGRSPRTASQFIELLKIGL
ncbi:MAG: ATP-binding protein [Firmicutes bacterium]|nr:ATP-binding protein [Bacillota bacterium]